MWTNRKAISLASSSPWRLHVSRFHHNIQVGSLPLIGQTSGLIPSHCSGLKNGTTVGPNGSTTHGSLRMDTWCRILLFFPFSKRGNNIHRSFYNCKLELLFIQIERNGRIVPLSGKTKLWAASRWTTER